MEGEDTANWKFGGLGELRSLATAFVFTELLGFLTFAVHSLLLLACNGDGAIYQDYRVC